jgi:hypothetical protein
MFYNRGCSGRSGKNFRVVTEVRNYSVGSDSTVSLWLTGREMLTQCIPCEIFLICKYGIPGRVVESGGGVHMAEQPWRVLSVVFYCVENNNNLRKNASGIKSVSFLRTTVCRHTLFPINNDSLVYHDALVKLEFCEGTHITPYVKCL